MDVGAAVDTNPKVDGLGDSGQSVGAVDTVGDSGTIDNSPKVDDDERAGDNGRDGGTVVDAVVGVGEEGLRRRCQRVHLHTGAPDMALKLRVTALLEN